MNLFNLMATLGLDSSEYEQGLDGAEQKANGFGEKLKSGLGAAAKVASAAIGAAATGITVLTKSAVSSFASYEQLVGGVETLFGESAERVLQDASNAYKTAGMDANKYMETSIQSAAALINSLEGDTETAAELMNMSIIDMSDNVNKMGTTMEAVQNAYRGFTRQNFTMLDNLALGFAGTKTGMQELLDKAQEISGIEYDISSYADIVQAIHVVQKEMGIAGTTADEAEGTITGSFAALRAGWQNLVTALATGEGDIDKLINDLVRGLELAIGNMLPAIERTLTGIGTLIEKLAPIIAEKLPKLFTNIVPSLISAAVSMVSAFAKAVVDNLPQIADAIMEIIGIIGTALIEHGPELLVSFATVLGQILEKITDPETLSKFVDGVVTLVTTLANAFIQNIPSVVDAFIRIMDNLMVTISNNLPKVIKAAKDIITSLVRGLIKALPELIKYIPTIVSSIVEIITENLDLIIEAAEEIITALLDGLAEMLPTLIEYIPKIIESIVAMINNNLPKIIAAAVKIIIAIINGLAKALPELIGYLPEIIDTIVEIITENLSLILDAGFKILMAIVNGIMDNLDEIMQAVLNLIDVIVEFVIKNLDKILEAGGKILGAIIKGIIDNLDDIILMVVDLIGKIISEITKKDNLDKILNAGGDLLGEIINGFVGAIPDFIERLPEIFNAIAETLGEQDWLQIGIDIITAIGKGLLQMGGLLWDVADTVFKGAYNVFADIFGLEKMGTSETGTVESSAGHSFSGGGRGFGNEDIVQLGRTRNISGQGYVTADEQLTNGSAGITINVYGAEGQNVSELAEIVSQRIATRTRQERMAW